MGKIQRDPPAILEAEDECGFTLYDVVDCTCNTSDSYACSNGPESEDEACVCVCHVYLD